MSTLANEDLDARILREFPWWKRRLICWSQPKLWRQARCMSNAYVTVLHTRNYVLAETLRRLQDKLWSHLYYGEDVT